MHCGVAMCKGVHEELVVEEGEVKRRCLACYCRS